MNKEYHPKKIEEKWQKKWAEAGLEKAKDGKKPKFYCLDMFPYPSGSGLHVGHWRGYVLSDIWTRYQKLNGKNVLHPMGFDAFGLPAENAAIKENSHPKQFTDKAIKTFKKQLAQIGSLYDWDREINTSDPDYYKWTQWLFLKLYEKGLAYKKKAAVNFCPSCQTVLANEQVVNNFCERCSHEVEKKELEQWFFKITDYADRLLQDLDKVDWPARTKLLQKNWIGRSKGTEIKFKIENNNNFLLIHGFEGSPEDGFFPWLKKELESSGYKVQVPKLPNPNNPKVYKQVEYVLKNCKIDENTILVGHSLGGVVALKILEKLKKPVNKTIIIGSFAENKFFDENFDDYTFDWKFEPEKIKKNSGPITILRDLKDNAVPQENTAKLHKIIGGKLSDYVAKKPHFCGDTEPAVIENILPVINVFTTRTDTLFGATYVVLAPEHELVLRITTEDQREKIEDYIKKSQKLSEIERTNAEKEKTGVFTGSCAINPANDEKIPVWVADYVLKDYASGAIMCVPAHDERDFEFAKKYDLPIREVITPDGKSQGELKEAYTENGVIINSAEFSDHHTEIGKREITKWLEQKGVGKLVTIYRLRDWLVSRQRYWGAPIPIVNCPKCGEIPVPEDQLPVKLPENVDFKPTGESPLARSEEFINTKCPNCGGEAKRETDTLDTFVCSSWYYLRYTDPKNSNKPFDEKLANFWMPTDLYIGGIEHATMHLLYARFISKFLHDQKIIDFDKDGEPFKKLFNIGLIYYQGAKMSKSKGNVISPDDLVEKYGSDALRGYEMFIGPEDQDSEWMDKGILGIYRFLNKIWSAKFGDNNSPLLHKTIKKVTEDIKNFSINTAISAMMEYLNQEKKPDKRFLILLSPIFPHITEEKWSEIGEKDLIFRSSWPEYDEEMIKEKEIDIILQVNGKLKDVVKMPTGVSEMEAHELAQQSKKIQKAIGSKKIKSIIYVEEKILNFVI